MAIVLNAAFLVVEFVAGLVTGSLALLSDAGHMLSDVGALVLALVAQRISRQKPQGFTYGLRRVPVIGGLINAATLFLIVGLIVYEAFERMAEPPPIDGLTVLVVGVIGLVVNLGSAWVLHKSGEKSVNIRGAMLHLLADALGSVAVIGSAVVIMLTDWRLIDPLLSLAIALLIFVVSVPLLKETLWIILQRAPLGLDVKAVRNKLLALPHVAECVDLHIWELNSGQIVLTATICTADDSRLAEITALSDQARLMLAEEFGIDHATLEWRHLSVPDPRPAPY